MIRVKYKETWLDKIYIPAILKGLLVTLKHLINPFDFTTIQYPEYKWKPRPHYRGAHRLNKDEKGRPKCVACEMCATACPSHCIKIVPAPAPWPDRERYPLKFEIDMLKCIYCQFCEEACPCKAIELTELYDFTGYSRKELIWDKEKLLNMYDLTVNGYYKGEAGTFSYTKEKKGK